MIDWLSRGAWRKTRRSPGLVCLIAYPAALAAGIAAVSLLSPMHPVATVLVANLAATLAIFAVASLLGNASIYDPYWSVAPPLAFAYWIAVSGEPISAREAIAFALVLIWSLRLTWNCMRRWHDMDHEDFRYRDLRERFPRLFPLVNLFGIELFPTLLVFAGCLPLYSVSVSGRPVGLIDVLAVTVTAGAIAIEAVADQQLRAYLHDRRQATRGEGVLRTGLWAWSRHPNYVGEIGFWWGLWLFGLAAMPGNGLWTVAGALAMTCLFVFVSVPLMEARKRLRHPGYEQQVSDIAPLFPGPLRIALRIAARMR